MRRAVAAVVALVLVAGACSSDDDDGATPATSSTATTTASSTTGATTSTTRPVVESIATSAACPGIGVVGDAEVTWIRDGRIWAAEPDGSGERCLAEFTGPASLQWGGDADRVLAGDRSVLLATGPVEVVGAGLEAIGWSRPTGRALLARDARGAISKLSVDGATAPLDLSVPYTDGEVVYHPAGTAIALVSQLAEGTSPPDLLLSNNRGEDVRWLVTNETADAIRDLTFTASGALVFEAAHGVRTHVHRLVLGSDTLEHLLDTESPVGAVVASPYDDELIAAGRTACADVASESMWVHDESSTGDVAATEAAMGDPVGWLPDGGLVVLVHPDGCDEQPGDLYVVADGDATLLAEDVDAAAVRAQLPPPPAPPPQIEAAPA